MSQLAGAVEGNASAAETQITQLRRELRDAVTSDAGHQREMLAMRANQGKLRAMAAKEKAAGRIKDCLGRMQKGSLGGRLAVWRRNAQAATFELAASGRVKEALAKAAAQSGAEREAACVALAKELRQERADMLARWGRTLKK